MSKPVKIFNFVFWPLMAFLLFIFHFSHGRLNSDNGIFLAGAWSLLNHLEIYKDFFSFTTPGAYYAILAVWKICGASYWAAWSLAISCLAISAVFIFKITIRLNRVAAYLAVVLFIISTYIWPIISSHVFCLPFIFSSAYLMIVWLEKRRAIFIYLAGFLAGISVLFLQTIGLATLVSFFLFLSWVRFQEKGGLSIKNLLGFLFFSSLPILGLFLKWSPLFLFDHLIRFPLTNYSETLSLNYSLLILNFIFLFVFLFVLSKRGRLSPILQLLFVWQFFLLITTFTFPDFAHISFVFAPLLIIYSFLLSGLLTLKTRMAYIRLCIILFLFLAYFFFYFSLAICLASFSVFSFKTKTPEMIVFLRENCQNQYIYAGPFIPEFYFEARKLTPGPSHWLLTNHHPAEYFSQTRQKLEELKPDCAIVNYKMLGKLNYNKDNELDGYIFSNYKQIKQFDDTIILHR